MKKLLTAALCAAALGAGGAARADVINFDNPALVDIDNVTGVATYTESGFAFSGPGASFLPLDMSLVGGIDDTALLSLKAVGGGAFSLTSLDRAFYDLGFGASPGTLSVTGLLNGVQVASQVFGLGALTTTLFGAGFGNLTEVTFSGTTAFALDNVNVNANVAAVPEPGTMALSALALLGVVLRVNRSRRRT